MAADTPGRTVSIVIPAHNAAATLRRCLAACLAQSPSALDVIVVDDGSTDDTASIARSIDGVQVVCQANAGPAAARNAGARAARGTVVAFTDADCVPAADWIAKLLDGLPAEGAGVGGTYAAANPESWLARCIQAEIAERHARFTETPKRCRATDPIEVDFLGSFNVAFRRECFEAAGGFDTRFAAASAEDNDLSYRLAQDGHRLYFTAAAVVAHYHPTRVWPYLRTQARHGYWRVFLYTVHPRRSGGDRYASMADLLRPPGLLGLIGLTLVWLAARGFGLDIPAAKAVLCAVWVVYLMSVCGSAIFRGQPLGLWTSVRFAGVLALRDLARGLGLCQGLMDAVLGRKAFA